MNSSANPRRGRGRPPKSSLEPVSTLRASISRAAETITDTISSGRTSSIPAPQLASAMNSFADCRRGRGRPPKSTLESASTSRAIETIGGTISSGRTSSLSAPQLASAMNSFADLRRGRGRPPKSTQEFASTSRGVETIGGTISSGRTSSPSAEQLTSPMNSSANPRRGRGQLLKSSLEPASTARPDQTTDTNYKKPPHPYESGILHKVNICPLCEKYTVIELNRNSGASNPKDEALRARFKCFLCDNSFDIGIVLFDPRGVPGVTVYKGNDRFVPPVPYRPAQPCPRCWTNSHTEFQCMTVYLKEENHVPCEPSCPPDRLSQEDLEKQVKATKKSKRTKRKSMQQVLKQVENVDV